jgi:CO/xanthine dehydrogenase FAD-binding subunit
LPPEPGFHAFRKVGTRQAQAISKVALALHATLVDGKVGQARVGFGAVAPTPLRARRVEALLQGRPLEALPLAEAREALQVDIAPIDDIRASAHYRRVVAGNVLVRMLEALSRA